ncbi:MAG: hypothetical protein U9R25_08295 [Chloroflexota bacterium]|nr:hypothetical protein [Chloroflexota bacterium]
MGDNNRTLLYVALAFLVGLLVGWFVLGWWLAPVEYTNAYLQDVRSEQQKIYLTASAEAYDLTRDRNALTARLQTLGDQEYVAQLAAEVAQSAEDAGDLVGADRMKSMAADVGLDLSAYQVSGGADPGEVPTPVEDAPPSKPPGDDASDNLWAICRAGLGLGIILAGIALALWLLTRHRSGDDEEDEDSVPEPVIEPLESQDEEVYVEASAPPDVIVDAVAVQDFIATFRLGDLSYDESFDIDDSHGSGYLGECGMTMSELVNGDPNRVTALEVWLFDKSDIRTVTKVLMSDFAYGNPALREKLSSRGEAVLLQPGMGFVLDAQTLRLEGTVMDLEYDESEAPARSTIRQLIVNLRVHQQQA